MPNKSSTSSSVPLLAVHLKARREALGLSQELAAEKLGVDKDTISRWERGRTRPIGRATLASIKEAYGVTQADLNDWFYDWSCRKLTDGAGYFVHGHEFLAANGMDEEELLHHIIELDTSMIPNLATVDEGTVAQWAPIFMASPLGWKLLTYGGKIVGYWQYVCLQEAFFERVKNGQLRDSELDVSMLEYPCFLTRDKTYRMYITMMGVHSAHQYFSPGGKLIHSFIREIEKAASNGVFFSEFVTVAHTSQGINLCRNFGMSSVGNLALSKQKATAEIFYGTGAQLSRMGHGSKHPVISRLYRERFR
ncbi:MAG: helix-turn-helix domain-containing protein [Hydrogenophaga sp.]